MAHLHNEGELLVLDDAFDGRTVDVGLFDDSTDQLTEDSTYGDITTEPDGDDYEPQTVDDPEVEQNADNNAEVTMGGLSFQVSDAEREIDYVYVRDDVSGDLIFTNALDQTYNLGSIDTLDLSNVGMELE
ncbi:hypothetical protein AArcSl_1290 [Halalkaliarchaeum desulfuricum]|uniref:Uncharacterized protein n=1 Tax=Halalkaliarchaeum desulfuricum TaxID=2055893 RepID=A0A343TIJ9_9EURY|nr:hypothetical protein [Halalkaliarchaeum desulfuricum]AUX08921.1 hypothetical protein AArcSl_1290 [Halalkaliarchaeum desulfuricum]